MGMLHSKTHHRTKRDKEFKIHDGDVIFIPDFTKTNQLVATVHGCQ